MGQYYLIANLDKQQFIDPHDFGEGAKILEFGCSAAGTMTALAILIADGNGQGSVVLRTDDPIVGSWAGDRIVVTGDYADAGRFMATEQNLYRHVREKHWQNVGERVITAMLADPYLRKAVEGPLDRVRGRNLVLAADVRPNAADDRKLDDLDDHDGDLLPLRPGDCFAFDGCAYVDGDVMYVEILEVVDHFADYVDHTGAATGGYRVAVFCDQEPQRAEDYYGWDFLHGKCVRLSAAEMARARGAGWPSTYKHFREVLGDELVLLDSRGVPVAPRGGAS